VNHSFRSVALASLVLAAGYACGGKDPVDVIGPPAAITFSATAAPTVLAGTAIPALTIRVADQSGRGVPNTPVTLSVTGGGTLNKTMGTTDVNGDVTDLIWTVGKSAVPQQLTVTATATGATATFNATIQTAYEVDLRFFGPAPAPGAASAFTNSAARIKGSVVGALGNVNFGNVNANVCGLPSDTAIGTSRGVIIYATVDSIDGPGKILGSAGPCFTRNSDGLTVLGVMRFDRDDINNLVTDGRAERVVLHEMLHVIGLGTLWESKNLLANKDSANVKFTGPKATAACVEAGGLPACGSGGVPAESCVDFPPANCGRGSQNGHWREPIFEQELMTPFIEPAVIFLPYSNMSIQSLADIGYTVNRFAADPYTVPFPEKTISSAEGGGSVQPLSWDIVLKPRFTITASGVVRAIEVAPPATRSVR